MFRGRTVNCISYLVQEYSKRRMTYAKDRVTAVAGLEERLAEALTCDSRFGIFQRFLHRNLLWQASDNKSKRIAYDHPVPSWSWMAIDGEIRFLDAAANYSSDLPLQSNVNLRFNRTRREVLDADLGVLQGCTLELDVDHHKIVDLSGTKQGWLQFDTVNDRHIHTGQCVVVGKQGRIREDGIEIYLILAVVRTGILNEYRRIGAGEVVISFVAKQYDNITIV